MSRGLPEGWPIVAWAAVGLFGMAAALLAAFGAGEEGVRVAIRASARTSLVLFGLSWTASSLVRLWPGPATAWVRRNRRQLGVSFAVSHGIHAVAIAWLALAWPESFAATVDATTLLGGGLGYAFLAAMTATSFDRTAAWLGPRRWKALHRTGAWVLWIDFAVSYVVRALVQPLYAPLAGVALALPALRMAARRRAAAAAPAPPGA